MSWLTELLLDHATAARNRLFDNYGWHQAAWSCFPNRPTAARDFLTRLDARPEGWRLLMVSPLEPTQPGWCPAAGWRSREIPPEYFSRARYQFQLRANPCRKIRVDHPDGARKKNGRRVPLTSREELATWLRHKGESGGFSLEEDGLQILREGAGRFRKEGQRPGLHSAVDFRGHLVIREAGQFHDTFTHGVGSAKAFGFGLLVLAPAA